MYLTKYLKTKHADRNIYTKEIDLGKETARGNAHYLLEVYDAETKEKIDTQRMILCSKGKGFYYTVILDFKEVDSDSRLDTKKWKRKTVDDLMKFTV